MESNEISIPDGIVQEIDQSASFIDIEVDMENENKLYSDVNLHTLYEDTLEDIERIWGSVPSFLKLFPKEVLIHDWPLWKEVGEMDIERARYLLSTDEILEEMLSKTQQ